jgi:hypothetical protein
VVSILARDRNGPAIAKQILVMPMLDDRTVTPDPQLAPFVLWSWDDNCTGWQALLGDAAGGPDTPVSAAPRASPTRPDSRPPTSRSANSISSATRTSPTPCASARPAPGRVPPPPRRPARIRLHCLQLRRRPARHGRPRPRPRLPVTMPPMARVLYHGLDDIPDVFAEAAAHLPDGRRPSPRGRRRYSPVRGLGPTPTGTPQHARRRNPMNQIELSVGTIDYHDTGQGPTSVLLPGC